MLKLIFALILIGLIILNVIIFFKMMLDSKEK